VPGSEPWEAIQSFKDQFPGFHDIRTGHIFILSIQISHH
jgi:hypothetical protein